MYRTRRYKICYSSHKGTTLKKVAVLTCGRSDFSIYLPLLLDLESRENISLYLIAFGSHTSHYHGYTVNQIQEYGFSNVITVDATLGDDKPDSIAISMGLTSINLAHIWKAYSFDLVFCLGDRYEMFAAVSSAVHFNLDIVHLHGGERTLGAIDNQFRHAITSMANYHFVSCEEHKDRVCEIVEDGVDEIYNVGALSLQNLKSTPLLDIDEFSDQFNIDLKKPTALVTYQPETTCLSANINNVKELLAVFDELDEQILLTLPNNDAMGAYVRETLLEYGRSSDKTYIYDFLGVNGYYSAMKYCSYLLGNTSSGIIEAASFNRYVINVGDRQKGRHASSNVYHSPCKKEDIVAIVDKVKSLGKYEGENIYYKPDTLQRIIKTLKLDR